MEKEKIEFTEFLEVEKKIEIKVGRVKLVEEVLKSNKLLKMTVDFGDSDIRTVVTNIKPFFLNFAAIKSLFEHSDFLFVTNLKPVTMMGIESTAMILPGELEKEQMILVNRVFAYGSPGPVGSVQSLKVL